ncbi:HK97-gp10 family putative phage morphogenesis protein [Heyndrickxia coagulans]|uniref:HK97-gp10 family putative phage morphogenesis protein n=1 Tax=Heyndrickxia coagulans TaxID=1398 RepID=UPI003D19675B
MDNHNGFLDALEEINTLLKMDKRVSMEALEEAAEYFVKVLKPQIPVSKRNKKHMRDSLKVVVKKDVVQVVFEGTGWYWHLAEHGHKKANGRGKVRGRHFVQNTWDKYGGKVAEIMTEQIINKMG